MTGFETMIYTDCRPGQGLGNGPGFQFQACSAGVDEAARVLMRNTLLYQPPSNWMLERRPVSEYPPSLAHIWDGRLITAAGRYLGKEANGGREGNQLTHGIVTTNPDDYGPVRPAQLFGAPFWTDRPAATTRCAPMDDDWEPGPFDASRAQELVLSTANGKQLLLSLVSILEQTGDAAQRILFVCDDAETVLNWLAAATLLLPQRLALGVSFKVFSTTPASDRHRVVAIHPDWNTLTVDVTNDRGYLVVDLTRHEWSQVEPTPWARLWAELFCTEDPYDVVDAIEVSYASGRPLAEGPVIGLAAVLGITPKPQQAHTVVAWLNDGPADQLGFYSGRVIDLIVGDMAQLPTAALRSLDEIARISWERRLPNSPWDDSRVHGIRLALLAAELRDAAAQGNAQAGMLPRLDESIWGEQQRTAGTDKVCQILNAAEPARFDPVLRVAKRFGLTVPYGELREAMHKFVAHWALHPGHGYTYTAWPDGVRVWDLLMDRLYDEAAHSVADAHRVGDAWWKILLPKTAEMATPLDRAVISAAVLHLPSAERTVLVTDFVHSAAKVRRANAYEDIIGVLFERRPAGIGELGMIADRAPAGTHISAEVFGKLQNLLRANDHLPNAEILLARRLMAKDLYHPPPDITRLLDAVVAAGDLADDLATATAQTKALEQVMQSLRPLIIRAHEDRLVGSLLHNREPKVVVWALGLMPDLAPAYGINLNRLVRTRCRTDQAVTALYIGSSSRRAAAISADLRTTIFVGAKRWVAIAPEQDLIQATDLVIRIDRDPFTTLWQQLVEKATGRSWVKRIRFWKR